MTIDEGTEGDPWPCSRLRRDTVHLWLMEVADCNGRWSTTHVRGVMDDLLDCLVDQLGWIVAPVPVMRRRTSRTQRCAPCEAEPVDGDAVAVVPAPAGCSERSSRSSTGLRPSRINIAVQGSVEALTQIAGPVWYFVSRRIVVPSVGDLVQALERHGVLRQALVISLWDGPDGREARYESLDPGAPLLPARKGSQTRFDLAPLDVKPGRLSKDTKCDLALGFTRENLSSWGYERACENASDGERTDWPSASEFEFGATIAPIGPALFDHAELVWALLSALEAISGDGVAFHNHDRLGAFRTRELSRETALKHADYHNRARRSG